ncbi:hypothetical protein ACH4E8_22835 [Streptomyces sp. NPDC017979]|uniref:hypothetical protein n=1 Tax=Streptomyces sp. NPDC017979 TaxID=3365024 RepID=UPI0037BCEF26
MFGMTKPAAAGACLREQATRRIHAAAVTVGGERARGVANKVTTALRLGRIDLCDSTTCVDCAPVK